MAAEALRTTLAANLAVDDSVGFEYPGPEGDLRRVVAAPGLTSGLMVAGGVAGDGEPFWWERDGRYGIAFVGTALAERNASRAAEIETESLFQG